MGVQSYPHTNVGLIAIRYLWLCGFKFCELDIYLLVGIIKRWEHLHSTQQMLMGVKFRILRPNLRSLTW
ncbi:MULTISPECIES: hypothetical protein [Cyanophyceae]|uniref:hypothetical protein n=1 Tax=Cyanophyceae TaxID=3028117 RepID=UPI001686EBCF|nr:hypothetical protein [Trichocoleus sp. FACHB-40]